MRRILQGIDYDDVLIVPIPSSVNSRSEVNVYSDLVGNITEKRLYPIFSAPMKEISGTDLVIALNDADCLGILHRFPIKKETQKECLERRYKDIKFVSDMGRDFGVSIGLGEVEVALYAQKLGANLICIDIANGYISSLQEFISFLRASELVIPIMTGNVVTYPGYYNLVKASADYIRTGIGSGSLCSTRDNIGIGYPQLSAIDNIYSSNDTGMGFIISDGGVINSSRAVKSFAFGADFVMVGTLFANALEAENKDGKIYGMASRKLQEDVYGSVKSVEGLELQIDITKKRPVSEIVSELVAGVQSAATYCDIRDYRKFRTVENIVYTGKGTLK